MSVLVGRETRLICQGLGRAGQFHAEHCIEYGTQLVAGVHPGRGGSMVFGTVPVFNTVVEAVKETAANATKTPAVINIVTEFLKWGIST